MKKRMLCLLLALVMTLSLCVPALAADEFAAEAVTEVEEQAPVAPVEPEAPEAEEPAEEPAAAAIAVDEPETISANVDAEVVTALNAMIDEADKILPLIGSTYCVQEPEDVLGADGTGGSNGVYDDVIKDNTHTAVTDHGKKVFAAALDTLKLYKAEITDKEQWYGGLSTKDVENAMDVMQDLMDRVTDEACDAEVRAIGANAIFDYNHYASTGWSQQSLDELLDAYELEVYPGYDSEYKDSYWSIDTNPSAQVLKLQPSYRAEMVAAIKDARKALAMEESNHAAVVAVRDKLRTLSDDYTDVDAGIDSTNNKWAVAQQATPEDLTKLSTTAQAAYAALAAEGVCAPDDKWGATLKLEGDSSGIVKKDGDKIKTVGEDGTIQALFAAVDSAGWNAANTNAGIKLAVLLSESVTTSPESIELQAVTKLLYVFSKLAPKTVPVDALLYGVTPISNVKGTYVPNQPHSPEITFKGFGVNVQGTTLTSGVNDIHTYYLKWSLDGKNQGVIEDANGDPVYLRFDAGVLKTVKNGTEAGTELTTAINVQPKKNMNAGQTIEVSLMAGMWNDDYEDKTDKVNVEGAHEVDTMTLKLDPSYIGPDMYDDAYYGYTGKLPTTTDKNLKAMLGDDYKDDTMYVAFDRIIKQSASGNDRYDDATVYFVGPTDTAGSFYLDIDDNEYGVAIQFTGDGSTNSESKPGVKLVPGDWKATVWLHEQDKFNVNVGDVNNETDQATAISVVPGNSAWPLYATIHVNSLDETALWATMKTNIETLSNYMSWPLKDTDDEFNGTTTADKASKIGKDENEDRTLLASYRKAAKEALEAAQRVLANSGKLVDIAQNRALVTAVNTQMTNAMKPFNTSASKKGDYTALTALIAQAEKFKEADYTATSWYDWSHPIASNTVRITNSVDGEWSVFNFATGKKTALDWAKDFNENHMYGSERQFYIDEAVRVFQMFIDKLVPVPADKTSLTSAIEKAQKDFDATKDYTEESLKAYQDALEAAKVVLNDPTATQTEVDDAVKALQDAVNGLKVKGDDDKPPVEEGPKAPASGTGWTLYNNEWYFFKNGTMVKNYWVGQADGASQWSTNWYYVGSDGKMATGMQYLDDLHGGYGWYFLQPTNTKGEIGKMLTGYQWVGGQYGECYFSKKSGESGKCTWSELLGNWNGTTWVK